MEEKMSPEKKSAVSVIRNIKEGNSILGRLTKTFLVMTPLTFPYLGSIKLFYAKNVTKRERNPGMHLLHVLDVTKKKTLISKNSENYAPVVIAVQDGIKPVLIIIKLSSPSYKNIYKFVAKGVTPGKPIKKHAVTVFHATKSMTFMAACTQKNVPNATTRADGRKQPLRIKRFVQLGK